MQFFILIILLNSTLLNYIIVDFKNMVYTGIVTFQKDDVRGNGLQKCVSMCMLPSSFIPAFNFALFKPAVYFFLECRRSASELFAKPSAWLYYYVRPGGQLPEVSKV